MIDLSLVLAIALALIHGFATKLPIFTIFPRFRWISFAAGVSLSYVFLEIFPELSHAQEEFQHSGIGTIEYLENHVYVLALLGVLVFYGLNLLAIKTKYRNSLIFWIQVGAFALLNFIMGYLLQDLGEHGLFACILFFITSALHLFIIDDNLREHQKSLYDRFGRWILVGAIIFGTVIGRTIQLPEIAIASIWSFLAGTIIINVIKGELPDTKKTCFVSFISGSFIFAMLLFVM